MFNTGGFLFYGLVAGVLTLVAGVVLVLLYRWAVKRYMQQGTASAEDAANDPIAAEPLTTPEDPVRANAAVDASCESSTHTSDVGRRAFYRAAVVYATAGFVHAVIAVTLYFLFSRTKFLPIRTFATFWAYAWPVVLNLILFWGPDRPRQILTLLAYFAVLALACLIIGFWSGTPVLVFGGPASATQRVPGMPFSISIPAVAQPALLWMLAASPSAFLLLFLNRRIRNVGPLILLFMMISMTGVQAAHSFVYSEYGEGLLPYFPTFNTLF
ncbi:MAG: hypothetical protein JO022_16355 [Acidobacteriaceae bacterium]|nr:hypothetical protein [Acidobacteriaceae bacterium]